MHAYDSFAELTVIRVTGTDRQKIVHNLCTQEVKGLSAGEGREAFFTNVKGKTLGHGFLYHTGDSYLIVGVPGQADRLVPHLDRYVITEDTQFVDESKQWQGVGVQGEEAEYFAKQCNVSPFAMTSLCFRESSWHELSVIALQTNWSIRPAWLCLVRGSDASTLEQRLSAAGWRTRDDQKAFESERILAGWPWFGRDGNEDNLPQEFHRNSTAISFTKGCYLGQETVARLDALGQVQKRMARWRFDTNLLMDAGTEVFAGEKSIAKITSAAICPESGRVIALAMTRRNHFDPGSTGQTKEGVQGEVF